MDTTRTGTRVKPEYEQVKSDHTLCCTLASGTLHGTPVHGTPVVGAEAFPTTHVTMLALWMALLCLVQTAGVLVLLALVASTSACVL